MSVLEKINFIPLQENQYYNELAKKTQIYIHHTASSPDPHGVLRWWNSTPERIATAFIIGGTPSSRSNWHDGEILQVFNSSKWAFHLGLSRKHLRQGGSKARTNTELNKNSIGIEICNWGGLTKTSRGFITYAKTIVSESDVLELSEPYRGYKYYQKYTDAQLESVRELLRLLCDKWNIPKEYKGIEMFDISPAALQGEPGIWTHTSVRPDKSDCFPQSELTEMLISL